MQNNNLVEGFLDLNVVYEKRIHENAVKMRKQEYKLRQQNIEKREE